MHHLRLLNAEIVLIFYLLKKAHKSQHMFLKHKHNLDALHMRLLTT